MYDLAEKTEKSAAILSTSPAGRRELRIASVVVVLSIAFFVAAAPFAQRPLPQVWAFIPIYEASLVVTDLITAVLLLGQFSILRSLPLLVLGSGYLFSALSAVAHALTFPGLFSQPGLLGAGPQTTAWLYMFWHGGFPLFVGAYALLQDLAPDSARWHIRSNVAIFCSLCAVLILVCGFTVLTTFGQNLLPTIMLGSRYTPTMILVVSSVWVLSLLALVILWRRPSPSVLNLWLMVVMLAWLFDIALAAVLNAGRFDLGFYTGRIYGLLASSFVLVVLLLENSVLHARLLNVHREVVAANKELEAFSFSVSHDLRSPLRAVDGYALMLEEDYGAQLDDEGRRLLGVVRSESARMSRLIDELLELSRVGRQRIVGARLDMTAIAREVAHELSPQYPAATIELDDLPASLGERTLVKQVWANLIGNALKYSAKSTVPRIAIGGRAKHEESEYWVRDNGSGFDMRFADRLFNVFQRLHRADEYPGTGVGLAIVQRIVKRHGGRVWAEGKVNEGALFGFSLPQGG